MQISAFRLINPMMTTGCKHQPISWMSWHQPNVCGCKRYALSHHVRWHVTEGLKYNTGCSSNIHDTGKMLNKKDNITFSNKWWPGTPFIIGKNTYRTGVVSLYLLAKWITVQFVEDDTASLGLICYLGKFEGACNLLVNSDNCAYDSARWMKSNVQKETL